jgi:PAS domain S-box-containing protein
VRDQSSSSTSASDELLRLIVDSATDFAIFTIDPNGVTTSWNRGAERLLGYPEAEIIGHSADVLFPAEEGGSTAAEDERRAALAHGRAEDERCVIREHADELDAAVLDINLGSETAYPVAEVLREQRVPFVFATGYDGWSIPEAYGDVPRCYKPVDAADVIRFLMARSPPQDGLRVVD